MSDTNPWSDERVLITGASRGLGQALAATLSERGATVVMVARGRPALEAAVAGIRSRGGRAHSLVADIADPSAPARIAAEAALRAGGPITILINNVSTLGPVPLRPVLDLAPADASAVIDTNLLGPLLLTRAVAGNMAVRGRGAVVSISSDAGVNAYAGWGWYGATKAAVDHLMAVLHVELSERGVRFVSVDPGEMDTQMHADALPESDPAQLARPGDVARAIVDRLRADGAQAAGRWEMAG